MTTSLQSVEDALFDAVSSARGISTVDTSIRHIVALLALKHILDSHREGLPEVVTFPAVVNATNLSAAIARAIDLPSRLGNAPVIAAIEELLQAAERKELEALAGALMTIRVGKQDLESIDALVVPAMRLIERRSGKTMFSLPFAVGTLLARLADAKSAESICDPACSHGVVLVAAACEHLSRDARPQIVDGAAPEPWAANMAVVLCALAGVPSAKIEVANVLTSPPTTQRGPYDCVVSAPPFNVQPPAWEHIDQKDRFPLGLPSRSADWLYVQHALSLLAASGTAALLLPRGALVRTGMEDDIRRRLVNDDLLDAVIALPAKALTGSSVRAVALVLRRSKPAANYNRILVVELVSDLGRPDRASGVDLVIRTLEARETVDTKEIRARVVDLDEVRQANYALDPARYLETKKAESPDLTTIWQDIRELQAEERELTSRAMRALRDVAAASASPRLPPLRE
jgi:type I restriction enzyme M protein